MAIGERERVRGFALAGVRVIAADDPEAVAGSVAGAAEDVGLVILTAGGAALALARALTASGLWVVMPG